MVAALRFKSRLLRSRLVKLVLGDWLLIVSICMQIAITVSYAYSGHWGKAWYWLSVTSITSSLAYMTIGKAF